MCDIMIKSKPMENWFLTVFRQVWWPLCSLYHKIFWTSQKEDKEEEKTSKMLSCFIIQLIY